MREAHRGTQETPLVALGSLPTPHLAVSPRGGGRDLLLTALVLSYWRSYYRLLSPITIYYNPLMISVI